MDKKTYEALKNIIEWVNEQDLANEEDIFNDTGKVEEWIDKVEKEYDE